MNRVTTFRPAGVTTTLKASILSVYGWSEGQSVNTHNPCSVNDILRFYPMDTNQRPNSINGSDGTSLGMSTQDSE